MGASGGRVVRRERRAHARVVVKQQQERHALLLLGVGDLGHVALLHLLMDVHYALAGSTALGPATRRSSR